MSERRASVAGAERRRGYKAYAFFVPKDVTPAVEEWLRVGKVLTGSPKKTQVLLMTIAEVISEWREREQRGERG